jgi:hypothetical protein
MILGGNDDGIFIEYCANTKVYFCSFRDVDDGKPDNMVRFQAQNAQDAGTEIVNCAFHLASTLASSNCIKIQNSNAAFTSDYNSFYTPHGATLGQNAGSDYTTLSGWQTATSQDAHSLTTNPFFKSATDLHVVGEENPLLRNCLPSRNPCRFPRVIE